MDKGLQKLRGFLAFGREKSERDEPLGLRDLLESLHEKSSLEVVVTLTDVYLPAVAGVSNLHMRFKLLENSRTEIERCLPALEKYVGNAALPLSEKARNAALRGDNLLKMLASTYAGVASGIEAQKLDTVLGHLLQQSARRAMQALLRRQLLAYRAYATPSASTWQHMHDLYRSTRLLRLAQGTGDIQTVEQCYATALMLAYADPNKFRRSEVDLLRAAVDHVAASAVLVEASTVQENQPATVSQFFIKTDEGTPGKPIARVTAGTPRAGNFILECRHVVAALDRRLNPSDEAAASPDPMTQPDLNTPEKILIALRTALGGQVTRRFHRQRFKPKADLVFGLPQLINFLDGFALARRQGDAQAQPGDFTLSEWAIVDESPDGFRVRYTKGDQQQFQAGDVIGLQQKDHGRIHVCLLRRIANIGNGHLELGLQEISSDSTIVTLPTGKAVFLHNMPGYARRPGILISPRSLPPDGKLTIELETGSMHYTVSRCIEENPGVELHLLEIAAPSC